GGAIAIDETEVHFYSAAFQGGIPDVKVAGVMTRSPDFATPDTPVAAVVQTLLQRDHTVLPVVDAERRVVGVIGDPALLPAGITSASLSLHKAADPDTIAKILRTLASSGHIVRDAMTTPAITIRDDASLAHAAREMHDRSFK